MKSIKVQTKILYLWRKTFASNTYVDTAKETELDVRTVRDALATGYCSKQTFDSLNAYALRKRAQDNKLIASLEK